MSDHQHVPEVEKFDPAKDLWYDKTKFNVDASGQPLPNSVLDAQFGNATRNPVRGAPYRDLDVALTKHTALTDKIDLEFRAEVFDVTNTPAFAQPNGSVGAAAFGTITATTMGLVSVWTVVSAAAP